MQEAIGMAEDVRLYLVSANKSRPGTERWADDDYDVRDGSADGPVAGRIYNVGHSPSGMPWFWAVQLYPAVADDRGTAETLEGAMAAFKAQWTKRRGWEHPWIRRDREV
jgi:hypothetical protein